MTRSARPPGPQPEILLQALSLIRWIAAARDGSNETAQQSLNDIEDLAAEAIHRS